MMCDRQDVFISWDDMHDDARTLARKLDGRQIWKGIVAVTRGGLVPAGLISQELEIKHIETLCLSSYDFQEQQDEITVLAKADIADEGKGWLVIDDLVDTGASFQLARKLYPGACFATLYAKPAGKSETDLFIQEFGQDTWIHFPWETGN